VEDSPNSTCTQFSSAYKRLLIHYEIARSNGNVEMQDNTTIFTVSSSTQQIKRLDKYDPVYNKIANLILFAKNVNYMINHMISLLLM